MSGEAGPLEGIGAAPGRALGRVHRLAFETPGVPHRTISADEVEAEVERFHAARAAARERLSTLAEETTRRFGPFEGRLFEVQIWMIEDPTVVEGTLAYIRENYLAAERAFELVMLEHRVRMLDSGQSMVLDQLSDLEDVRSRVLAGLLDLPEAVLPGPSEEPLVVVARDIPPSVAVRIDPERVVGIVTERGSRGAHSVVIARSLGIPAVVGVGTDLECLAHGDLVLVDGQTGRLVPAPSEREIEGYHAGRLRLAERRRELGEAAAHPARTADGVDLTIEANVDRPDEVERAVASGAEGVGLFRSEFLVIGHREIPSEAEQYEAYRAAVEAADGREVTLRTFDIGGDKFPMFLRMPREENPYLGWRAIRVCLDLPELFLNQLRAAVRAAAHGPMRILLPFIISPDEVERTRGLLSHVYEELGDEAGARRLPLGVMVETPAAVELLDRIAPLVDFVSVGTNDLTQYVLAADRGNAKLAGLFDAMHPALVAQYRRIVATCREHDLDVSVCGELAAEPAGMALLIGLGYRRFSMSVAAIAEQRALARQLSAAALAELTAEAAWPDGHACRGDLARYLAELNGEAADVPLSAE